MASADSGWHETDRFNAHTWEGGVEMVATSFLLLCVVRWEKRKAEAGRVGGADALGSLVVPQATRCGVVPVTCHSSTPPAVGVRSTPRGERKRFRK